MKAAHVPLESRAESLYRFAIMAVGGTEAQPFPETNWTLVLQAGEDASTSRRSRAITEWCRLYWQPIYCFIRLQGRRPHDAEDLTQGFFARFLKRNDIAGIDASRGRMRSYLVTAVKNYLISEHKREVRQKRGGATRILSIEALAAEARLQGIEPAEAASPEAGFDRQWALTLVENAVQTLAERYQQDGKGELFLHLKDFVGPRGDRPKVATVAEALGMSEPALRVAIHRFRERYRECLLASVAYTLAPGEDAEEELRHLMSAFG